MLCLPCTFTPSRIRVPEALTPLDTVASRLEGAIGDHDRGARAFRGYLDRVEPGDRCLVELAVIADGMGLADR